MKTGLAVNNFSLITGSASFTGSVLKSNVNCSLTSSFTTSSTGTVSLICAMFS
jgi:hypothetical protein